MKFKIDENLPVELAEILALSGHDAVTVRSENLQGKSDATIVGFCEQEGRIVVTMDLDFADILAYPPHRYPGFLVLRPRRQDKYQLMSLLRRAIPLFLTEPLEHRLWIVEENRIRIRSTEPD